MLCIPLVPCFHEKVLSTYTQKDALVVFRFSGNKETDINIFIDGIKTHKQLSNVSDGNALRGLSMLLDGCDMVYKERKTLWIEKVPQIIPV